MAQFTLAQAFGQVPEEEPAPQTTDFAQAPQLVDDLRNLRSETQPSPEDLAALRQSQQSSLQAHTDFANSRQQMQGQLEQRSGDIEATKGFLQATDANLSRPARNFAMRGWMKSQGIDPNSAPAKELITLASTLPPNELTALRGAVVDASANAPPGSMVSLFKGIGTGQIGAGDLLTRVGEFQSRQAGQVQAETAQAFPVSDRTQSSRVPVPPNTEVPPIHREVDPSLLAVLPGATPRMSLDELQQLHPNAASDPEGQRKLADKIRTENSGMRTLIDEASDLSRLIKGDSASLGPVGTGAQYWESFRAQTAAALGIARDALPDPESSAIRRAADRLSNKIMGANGLEGTADNRARINSLVTRMAYSMLQQNEPGGRFTEQDILRAMAQIGQSADPSQFQASLKMTVANQYRSYQRRLSEATGSDMQLPIDRLPMSRIVELGQNEMAPMELRAQAATIYKQRTTAPMREQAGKPGTETTNEPAPQGGEPRSGEPTQQTAPRGRVERSEAADRQTQQLKELRELLAQSEALSMARNRDRRDQSQEDRAGRTERRQLQWREEDKLERAQAKLSAAIQGVAKALGSGGRSPSGGGGGSSGGSQSDAAFKIPAKPVRQAPRLSSPSLTGFGGIKVK